MFHVKHALFADAEGRKHHIEHAFDIVATEQLLEGIDSETNVLGGQFRNDKLALQSYNQMLPCFAQAFDVPLARRRRKGLDREPFANYPLNAVTRSGRPFPVFVLIRNIDVSRETARDPR